MSSLEPRCKLCTLLQEDENLWIEVHNKVLKDKISQSLAMDWLNSKVEELNANPKRVEKLQPFNHANFSVHFDKHVTSALDMMHRVDSKVSGRTFSAAQQIKAEVVQNTYAVGEYERLEGLINSLEDNISSYKETMDKNKASGKLTFREIQNYSGFVAEYLEARQSLSKLRSIERSTSLALNLAVESVIKGLADRAAKVADDIKDFMSAELPSSRLPEEVMKQIKSRFSGELTQLALDAVDKARKEYGIK